MRIPNLTYNDRKPLYHTGHNLQPAYPGDAGFDLKTAESWAIEPKAYSLIPCRVRVEFPAGVFGWIVGRSSTFSRYGLIVLPGIIDTGFRGELYAAVYNTTGDKVTIEEGDRIAQLVLLPNVADGYQPEQVLTIDTSSVRGSNGFGSSGK